MAEAQSWLGYFAAALLVGLQAALPVLVAVALAGLAASFLQTMIGYGDAALGQAFRVGAAAVALALFGGWTAAVVLAYWRWAWEGVPGLMGGAP